jgi:DMSO/TMAO reductase YedYZ heme-binding membrane subunit
MKLQGWNLTIGIGLILLICDALLLGVVGSDEEGVRTLVRFTARAAAAIFSLVFATSSLRRLWPNAATRWLLVNRRYLGVAFAVAHGLHLGTLVLLSMTLGPIFLEQTPALTLIGGGAVSALIAAMALTSSDRAQAVLGRRWRWLHRAGSYGAWSIYLVDYAIGFTSLSIHTLFGVLMVGAMGLRLAAWQRSRVTATRVPAETR